MRTALIQPVNAIFRLNAIKPVHPIADFGMECRVDSMHSNMYNNKCIIIELGIS